MDKLLIISRLTSCEDVQELIKSYLFFDEVQSHARQVKHFAIYCIKDGHFNNVHFWGEFWDETKLSTVWFFMQRKIHMASKFCEKCGNYTDTTTCIKSCVCRC